ncbi:hypothetical protein G5B40_11915 [Pikeienuella piscinae]|uniref:Uncharacterized protein n=1 Tax=Pikeienuella piscinae TaxID=2748098 RepID=A0A7L5BUW4_9RHOB|nr:hypothetical protein [Pikeienuella piscinae]QIE56100.1 hypothetical protein G5B40_11915 [Pikeienuella piscinae]
MKDFGKSSLELGAEASRVVAHICHRQGVDEVTMLCHAASTNWRQRYTTTRQRLDNLEACLEYKVTKRQPINLLTEQVSQLGTDGLKSTCDTTFGGGVMSITSSVHHGIAHIPMMNLHPNEGVLIEDIVTFIRHIYPGRPGYILSSGRHFHYYGDFLVDESGWRELLGYFLIAYDFVHPGYCGFRLFDGYSTLRLTAQPPYKPHVPKLVATI